MHIVYVANGLLILLNVILQATVNMHQARVSVNRAITILVALVLLVNEFDITTERLFKTLHH